MKAKILLNTGLNSINPKKATLIASFCALCLALIKLTVALFSNSLAVLSSALDSLMDFVISVLNFFAIKKAAKESNASYNFGFDKLEALMGLLEALFITAMALFIFYEGVNKLYKNEGVTDLSASLAVMIFASLVSLLLTLFLSSVAKRTKSLIVEADSLHYRTDFLTNLATFIALTLIYFTNLGFIDGLFAILISLYICLSALKIAKKSIEILMDKALDEKMVARIKELISQNSQILSFHELKTRLSPATSYLSVHLVFTPLISLSSAHAISDELEARIKAEFKEVNFNIQIHLDPYDDSIKKDTV
ncbi:cation diffusion facilitator family transporter [Campylobacter troglodytis]|uniref:cation diffusion facilitator family transporter n=1 Tax=Campylobacter troglodytis TaxID=654363 RepID=UPI001158A56E|nr:cation diffusion facilitator family transporter [Campylobacter troglodytis]TQR56926.1 cation transporter [Campylobacter troglodytis]